MFRSTLMLILSFVLFGWIEADAQKDPQITVVVYNDAAVPARLIESAREVVASIYRDVGVAIIWKDHSDPAPSAAELFVRLVRHSLNLPGEDFGIAFVGSDGQGVQADIFYSGIERLTNNTVANSAQIMGHVMAHELGHLLLGMNSHSNFGVMQAHWTDQQLRLMSKGVLKFDKHQAKAIVARLISADAVPPIAAEFGNISPS
jgi:hypothetical protein